MAVIETGEVAATGCSHQKITDPTRDKSSGTEKYEAKDGATFTAAVFVRR